MMYVLNRQLTPQFAFMCTFIQVWLKSETKECLQYKESIPDVSQSKTY